MSSNLGKRVLKHGFILTTTLLTCTALQADHNDQHGDKTQQFIQKAAMGGHMEVQMGQLAEQKAQSQEVKNLGATLVRDHTQANQRLEQLASSKNITLDKSDWADTTSSTSGTRSTDQTATTGTSTESHAVKRAEHKEHKEFAKLESQSGAEFDKSFVRMAIKDHKKDISEFEHARNEVTDPEIKAFIDQTLPKLRNHLQMAQSAAKAVGVTEASITSDREEENAEATGAPAAGAVGTRGSDKPSSPASNPNLNKQSSSYSSDRLNGATDSAASGTVRHNADANANLDANVGDHSISASADADKADANASSSTDTTKKRKIFSTDKNDGKFLGIIPDPFNKDHHKGPSAGADVNVNGHEASVGASAGSESSSSSSSDSSK